MLISRTAEGRSGAGVVAGLGAFRRPVFPAELARELDRAKRALAKNRSLLKLAAAGLVGGGAALSWCLWIVLAFGRAS